MTRTERLTFAGVLVLTGLILCGLKWAGWALLAGESWWLVAAAPALALSLEFALHFACALVCPRRRSISSGQPPTRS